MTKFTRTVFTAAFFALVGFGALGVTLTTTTAPAQACNSTYCY